MQDPANGSSIDGADSVWSQFSGRMFALVGILVSLAITAHIVFQYNLTNYGAPAYLHFSAASPLIGLAALAAFTWSLGQQRYWPVDIWLVVLTGLALASLVQHGEHVRAVMLLLLLTYCIYAAAQNSKLRIAIMYTVLTLAILSAIQTILAAFRGESVFLSLFGLQDVGKFGTDDPRPGFGFTYNSVQASIVMLMGIAAITTLWKRHGMALSCLLLFLFCIGMVLIGSRAGAVALVAIIVWFFLARRFRQGMMLFLVFVSAIGACNLANNISLFSPNSVVGKAGGYRALFDFEAAPSGLPVVVGATETTGYPQTGNFRIEMGKIALDLFLERPFFGHGLGSFPEVASNYVGSRPELMNKLLGIDGASELADALGRMVEQPPGNFGVDADHWTLPLMHEVIARDHPGVSPTDIDRLMSSGAIQSYGELSEGLDAHSLYTSLLVETGIVGFLIFFGFLIASGFRATFRIFVGPNSEETDFIAGVTLLLVGTAVIGLFWHILLYRDTAIAVGLFLACVPLLKRNEAH